MSDTKEKRGTKTTKDPYMGVDWSIDQNGKYQAPSVALFNIESLGELKARIREKLNAQEESYTASEYLLALLEQEISEETNRLFESEFSEGCSSKEGDYEDDEEGEEGGKESKKPNKKKEEKM